MRLMNCEHITMQYERQTVISDVTFHVDAGDYLCIVGENGSGKSTLMRGLLGLKGLSGGNVSFDGGLRQCEIGYLPQQSAAQREFPASVSEVVISGCQSRKGPISLYSAKDKARAAQVMERLDLTDLRHKSFRMLSGGQQQRVLLARALCATEKLLLLDEPVSALDPMATAEFYSLLDDLNKRDGITILMISHDLAGTLSGATHILHLYDQAYFYGTKEAYLATPLGARYTGGTPAAS